MVFVDKPPLIALLQNAWSRLCAEPGEDVLHPVLLYPFEPVFVNG